MSSNKKKVLKIIVLGDTSVGKTSIIRQYIHQKFSDKYKATIGADFFSQDISIDDTQISLQVWDTAGQERFQSLGSAFYRGADACILTFDLTNAKTFKDLKKWQDEFLVSADPRDPLNFPFAVFGNKCDLPESERTVTKEMIEDWCKNSRVTNIPYFETSAKENINIESSFTRVIQDALKLKQEESVAPEIVNVNLANVSSEDKKQKCQC